jgi:hypothetical protein
MPDIDTTPELILSPEATAQITDINNQYVPLRAEALEYWNTYIKDKPNKTEEQRREFHKLFMRLGRLQTIKKSILKREKNKEIL